MPSDDEENLKEMKADIEKKGGNIKKGIIGLWEHGKKRVILLNNTCKVVYNDCNNIIT